MVDLSGLQCSATELHPQLNTTPLSLVVQPVFLFVLFGCECVCPPKQTQRERSFQPNTLLNKYAACLLRHTVDPFCECVTFSYFFSATRGQKLLYLFQHLIADFAT
jgi:hypothetical protein